MSIYRLIVLLLFISTAALSTLTVRSTPFSQQFKPTQVTKLLPSDGEEYDYFGRSVVIDGNLALIGTHRDDDNKPDSGSVYVFDMTTGDQLAKLAPNDGDARDYFGHSMALNGNLALVGAYLDDDNGFSSGSVYVFDVTTGNQLAKLMPEDGNARDYFGYAVALDGNLALVGAYLDDDNGLDSGSVYVFDVTTGNQLAKLMPEGVDARDSFGYAVALDGNLALIGAYHDAENGIASGSAYVFDVTNGSQLAKLMPEDGAAGDRFGRSVALDGNRALIGTDSSDDNGPGSGSVYVFDVTTGSQLAKLTPEDGAAGDRFGRSVALDGNHALIGTDRDDDSGADSGSAYVFDWVTGSQLAKLAPTDGDTYNYFGYSVALDGDNALVGAYHDDDNGRVSGSAYLFSIDDEIAAPSVDVNGDGVVTPADAIMVINRIDTDDLSVDVNGDETIDSEDVDQVLGQLGTAVE